MRHQKLFTVVSMVGLLAYGLGAMLTFSGCSSDAPLGTFDVPFEKRNDCINDVDCSPGEHCANEKCVVTMHDLASNADIARAPDLGQAIIVDLAKPDLTTNPDLAEEKATVEAITSIDTPRGRAIQSGDTVLTLNADVTVHKKDAVITGFIGRLTGFSSPNDITSAYIWEGDGFGIGHLISVDPTNGVLTVDGLTFRQVKDTTSRWSYTVKIVSNNPGATYTFEIDTVVLEDGGPTTSPPAIGNTFILVSPPVPDLGTVPDLAPPVDLAMPPHFNTCNTDADCAPGERCNLDGTCVIPCNRDIDCGSPGLWCAPTAIKSDLTYGSCLFMVAADGGTTAQCPSSVMLYDPSNGRNDAFNSLVSGSPTVYTIPIGAFTPPPGDQPLLEGFVGALCNPISLTQLGFTVEIDVAPPYAQPANITYAVGIGGKYVGKTQGIGGGSGPNSTTNYMVWQPGGLALVPNGDSEFTLVCTGTCNTDLVAAHASVTACIGGADYVGWDVGAFSYAVYLYNGTCQSQQF